VRENTLLTISGIFPCSALSIDRPLEISSAQGPILSPGNPLFVRRFHPTCKSSAKQRPGGCQITEITENGTRRRRRIIILLAIIIVFSAAFLTWIAWQTEQQFRQSEQHEYMYEIVLSFNATLENVTLLLPVPERNGTPFFTQALVDRTAYGVPPDWNLSIQEENGTPMLAIRADRMNPKYHSTPVPIESGQTPLPTTLVQGVEYTDNTPVLMPVWMVVTVPVNHTIDTRDPLSGEPLFYPEGSFVPGSTNIPGFSGSVHEHTAPVFVQFTADQSTTFSLRTEIQGTNSIWRLGWTFNQYSDTVTLEIRDSRQGWLEGKGILLSGEGVYW
jgi:hypothetical protein